MGQCRDLLPVKLVAEFEAWLRENGYEIKDTKAACSMFQVRVDGKGYEIYVRDRTYSGNDTVHASIYGPVIGLAKRFLNERKKANGQSKI